MSAPPLLLSISDRDVPRSSTQVALKAREVLIACQMPSYEERKNQMEAILQSSVKTTFYGEQDSDIK